MRNLTLGIFILVWNLAAWVAWIAAIVVIGKTPAARYVHGWRTKGIRMLVIFVVAFHAGGLYIPAGALAVLVASRRGDDGGLDLASGRGPRLPNWTDYPEEGPTDERH